MSSFFTAPGNQRKRKRTQNSGPTPSRKLESGAKKPLKPSELKRAPVRDDSISGSDSEEYQARNNDLPEESDGASDSESAEETAAERRLKLAERYLENIRTEVQDEIGYDAADIDRDLIAERLQEDVAESKGKLYRQVALNLSFNTAVITHFRMESQSTTAVAVCEPYAYTASKDMKLIKWELALPVPEPTAASLQEGSFKRPRRGPPPRRRPKVLLKTRGNAHPDSLSSYQHHTGAILCIAASPSGLYLASGGSDKRLILWSTDKLTALRVFTQHRDSVLSLSFRPLMSRNEFYSSSADRTIKTWAADERAYVETLFGHQDHVTDLIALPDDKCLSVGARDRTARLWKIVDETQLVFRGSGGGGGSKKGPEKESSSKQPLKLPTFSEGSIDRVAFIDAETFVTGSDNGSLCLWNIHKKKPVFNFPLAHGLWLPHSADEYSAELDPDGAGVVLPEPQPRWITALATVPYTDVILSGSWDGAVRAWRVSDDRKRIEALGPVGPLGKNAVVGVINDIGVFLRGERGRGGLCIVAALGNQHRLGRWLNVKARNDAVVIEVSVIKKEVAEEDVEEGVWAKEAMEDRAME
ncbi:MAG: pre-rRNA processing protein [Trizodia sp. TS-e1964]|nr:MAG: pre-rRNA processing protein [Trizodia sp. TS-e1964]